MGIGSAHPDLLLRHLWVDAVCSALERFGRRPAYRVHAFVSVRGCACKDERFGYESVHGESVAFSHDW